MKVWAWLKKWWKVVLLALGAIAALILGLEIAGLIRSARLGKVERADPFKVLDPDHLSVLSGGVWQTVDLTTIKAGRPVKAAEVRAVSIKPKKQAVVEVHNMTLGGIVG